MAGLLEGRRITFWLEANQGSVTEIEHWTLDHRGLCEHQFNGFRLVEIGFAFVFEFAKGRACTVQNHLPTVLIAPLGQVFAVDTGRLVVMKLIADGIFIEPGTGFFMVSQALMPKRCNVLLESVKELPPLGCWKQTITDYATTKQFRCRSSLLTVRGATYVQKPGDSIGS